MGDLKTLIDFFGATSPVGVLLTSALIFSTMTVAIINVTDFVKKKFRSAYYKKKGLEDKDASLEYALKEIKGLRNDINSLKDEVQRNNDQSRERDRAILRDRCIQAIRYFGTNMIKEDGKVHISMAEYETILDLFRQYFSVDGNGPVQHLYETEFKLWIIDK